MGSRDMGSEGMNFTSVQAVPSSSSSESSGSLGMFGVSTEMWLAIYEEITLGGHGFYQNIFLYLLWAPSFDSHEKLPTHTGYCHMTLLRQTTQTLLNQNHIIKTNACIFIS